MTSALSVMSLESKRLKYGQYSLWYTDKKLYFSDGVKINYLNLDDTSVIEWSPDTQGTYPALPSGTQTTTLRKLLQ